MDKKPFGDRMEVVPGTQGAKANIFPEEYVAGLEDILEKILDDGTGDVKQPDKRLWPIRAANYREARRVLDSFEWRKKC